MSKAFVRVLGCFGGCFSFGLSLFVSFVVVVRSPVNFFVLVCVFSILESRELSSKYLYLLYGRLLYFVVLALFLACVGMSLLSFLLEAGGLT